MDNIKFTAGSLIENLKLSPNSGKISSVDDLINNGHFTEEDIATIRKLLRVSMNDLKFIDTRKYGSDLSNIFAKRVDSLKESLPSNSSHYNKLIEALLNNEMDRFDIADGHYATIEPSNFHGLVHMSQGDNKGTGNSFYQSLPFPVDVSAQDLAKKHLDYITQTDPKHSPNRYLHYSVPRDMAAEIVKSFTAVDKQPKSSSKPANISDQNALRSELFYTKYYQSFNDGIDNWLKNSENDNHPGNQDVWAVNQTAPSELSSVMTQVGQKLSPGLKLKSSNR